MSLRAEALARTDALIRSAAGNAWQAWREERRERRALPEYWIVYHFTAARLAIGRFAWRIRYHYHMAQSRRYRAHQRARRALPPAMQELAACIDGVAVQCERDARRAV